MCFMAILYECGHEEKSLLECRNRIGLRGLVKALLDLLRPNGEGQPLPCDHVAAESARRGHKCRWCLMQQIPDLLQRERQRLRMLRGDFADGLVEPVPVRSLPRRAIQRRQQSSKLERVAQEAVPEAAQRIGRGDSEYAQKPEPLVDASGVERFEKGPGQRLCGILYLCDGAPPGRDECCNKSVTHHNW
ncbi:uncharacterized protein BBA_01954 [Beauveria bassiana ARSEF 2860]|uniref:Uncharacterized protein n=1 Tax=Beauveria bassiana (strain ARSEF 2860) TaxID=655819 RepID=J4KQB6_BEAB2|nr:uncharacterized protein BBA_01954 [Beauveria bassiana ARSEF 2860]EJP68919.1 hypothetical protein BBA_01954 [Beauveria bassiana ARSEF 2860]